VNQFTKAPIFKGEARRADGRPGNKRLNCRVQKKKNPGSAERKGCTSSPGRSSHWKSFLGVPRSYFRGGKTPPPKDQRKLKGGPKGDSTDGPRSSRASQKREGPVDALKVNGNNTPYKGCRVTDMKNKAVKLGGEKSEPKKTRDPRGKSLNVGGAKRRERNAPKSKNGGRRRCWPRVWGWTSENQRR